MAFTVEFDPEHKGKFPWLVIGGLGAGRAWVASNHETEQKANSAADKYNRGK